MAITLVGSATPVHDGTPPASVPYASTAGNLLVLTIQHQSGVVSSITDDGGNTWTLAADTMDLGATSQRRVAIYYCLNANAITSVTVTVASGVAQIFLDEWAGVGGFGSALAQKNGTTATPAPAAVSASSGDLVYGALAYFDSTGALPVSYGTGYTETAADDFGSSQVLAAAYSTSVSGSTGPTFTLAASSNTGAVTASFTPAATGPSEGSASGTLPLAGSATGSTSHLGSASGALGLSGSTTGGVRHIGSFVGSTSLSGSASGSAQHAGSTSAALPLDGSATGATPHQGSTAGALALDGQGSGSTRHLGSSVGSLPISGSATGTSPVVGGASGSSSGTLPLAGSATGSTRHAGSTAGQLPLAGSASGAQPGATRDLILTETTPPTSGWQDTPPDVASRTTTGPAPTVSATSAPGSDWSDTEPLTTSTVDAQAPATTTTATPPGLDWPATEPTH